MGEGDKPTRYLVRPDYPGRDPRPPQVLRVAPAITRVLMLNLRSDDGMWDIITAMEYQRKYYDELPEKISLAARGFSEGNATWRKRLPAALGAFFREC